MLLIKPGPGPRSVEGPSPFQLPALTFRGAGHFQGGKGARRPPCAELAAITVIAEPASPDELWRASCCISGSDASCSMNSTSSSPPGSFSCSITPAPSLSSGSGSGSSWVAAAAVHRPLTAQAPRGPPWHAGVLFWILDRGIHLGMKIW